eukprot:gene28202-31299_t
MEVIKTVSECLDGSSADKGIGAAVATCLFTSAITVMSAIVRSVVNLTQRRILEVIKTVSELLDGSSADKTIGAAVATCLFTSAITFMTAIVRSVVNLTNLDFPERCCSTSALLLLELCVFSASNYLPARLRLRCCS